MAALSRSENMSRIRSRDSKPEMAVRRIVYGLGYRYRLHAQALPGRPDLVFQGRRKIIFVHGCFWHGHLDCKIAHKPKSNRSYWSPKIARNNARDERNILQLRSLGWDILVLWECELKDVTALTKRISAFLCDSSPGPDS